MVGANYIIDPLFYQVALEFQLVCTVCSRFPGTDIET